MLSEDEARAILQHHYKDARVETGIDLDDVWVFRTYLPIGGGEEVMNPFMSVDKKTGDARDFAVASYPDKPRLAKLFSAKE